MTGLFRILSIVVALLLGGLGVGHAVERVSWEDLAPTIDESEFAFDDMTEDQIYDLYDVLRARRLEKDGDVSAEWKELADQGRARLVAAGFDVEALIQRVDIMQKKIEIRDETLIEELDGKEIQLPGYVLPLAFSGETVTEFLLVPYIGACIHTPPPPANQIVHVRVPDGLENQGLYTAVWVTGRISTGTSEQSLSYIDGTANIRVGYSMDNVTVEPYEE